jgi:hypothetical protein
MVVSPFSRWSAPLNTAITPEFLIKSAHMYGDSAEFCRELFRLEGPGDCLKSELLSLHLLNIGFLGISLNLGPEISHTCLGVIVNRILPS